MYYLARRGGEYARVVCLSWLASEFIKDLGSLPLKRFHQPTNILLHFDLVHCQRDDFLGLTGTPTAAEGRDYSLQLIATNPLGSQVLSNVFRIYQNRSMSTLAAVKRETKSYRWPAFMFAYMTGLAYLLSFGVFQIGSLLGF